MQVNELLVEMEHDMHDKLLAKRKIKISIIMYQNRFFTHGFNGNNPRGINQYLYSMSQGFAEVESLARFSGFTFSWLALDIASSQRLSP